MSKVNMKLEDEQWDVIGEISETTGSAMEVLPSIEIVSESADEKTVDAAENPIGALQEACTAKKLSAPDYRNEFSTGPPHIKTFGVTCFVGTQKTVGLGKSKKLAKKAAALEMLASLDGTATAETVTDASPEVQEVQHVLNELSIEKVTENIESYLRSLASKLNIRLEFVAQSEIEGRCVCICQLGKTKVTGFGEDPEAAKSDAAASALQHIKMIHAA